MKEEFGCLWKDLLIARSSIGLSVIEIDEKVFQLEWNPFGFNRNRKGMVDLSRSISAR